MRFMNEYEIHEAEQRYWAHPVLGPATRTLSNLAAWSNANSDGWAHWPKPTRAAEKLMALIEGDDHPWGAQGAWRDPERSDATGAAYRAALRPIKAFRTRHGASFEIVNPQVPV
jgi:hypothetical protein